MLKYLPSKISMASTSGNSKSEKAELSSAQCDRLCQQFIEVTQTNTAEAIMYLQEKDWQLDLAVEAFFNAAVSPKTPAGTSSKVDSDSKIKDMIASDDTDKIRILSWNLDGLDDVSLIIRTKAAISEINQHRPDVVFLQEVVPESYEVINREMNASYDLFAGATFGYFTLMMMKKDTVWVDSKQVKPFFSSVMLRKLQIVHANVKGIDFKLMTSHLESTRDHAKERKRQLEFCFTEMKSADNKMNVVFGGDLNLGRNDLNGVTIPNGVIDLWEDTGSRTEAQYTWDMARNCNKQMRGGAKPRCRFDRFYFRPPTEGVRSVKPRYFELVGLEKVKGCSKFVSDHWGILCHFNVIS